MTLNGLPAPALGVEERSDETPSAGAGASADVGRPGGCGEAEAAKIHGGVPAPHPGGGGAAAAGSGEVGQLLRREGLYSSHLTAWRKARRDGALRGLSSKKRGAKPKASNPLEPKVRELEAKVARLEKDLHKAHTILDVQEKVAGLLGFSLEDGKDC